MWANSNNSAVNITNAQQSEWTFKIRKVWEKNFKTYDIVEVSTNDTLTKVEELLNIKKYGQAFKEILEHYDEISMKYSKRVDVLQSLNSRLKIISSYLSNTSSKVEESELVQMLKITNPYEYKKQVRLLTSKFHPDKKWKIEWEGMKIFYEEIAKIIILAKNRYEAIVN